MKTLFQIKVNNSGQGLAESLLILPVFMIFMFSLAGASYQIAGYYWSDHALQQALLCHDSNSTMTCQNELRKVMKKFFIFNEKIQINFKEKNKAVYGKIIVRWNTSWLIKTNEEFTLQQKISLPLKPAGF